MVTSKLAFASLPNCYVMETTKKLRSENWFNNPENPGMTAIYIERFLSCRLESRSSELPRLGVIFRRVIVCIWKLLSV